MKPIIAQTTLHFLMLIAAALSAPDLQAQSATFEWAKLLTSRDDEARARDATVDRDGNTIVAYSQVLNPAGELAIYTSNVVTKVDSRGELIWSLSVLPHIYGISVDVTGSIYVAGSRLGLPLSRALSTNYFKNVGITTEGNGSAYVAKLSPAGVVEWVRLIGDSVRIEAMSVRADSKGDYYVAGHYIGSAQIDDILLPTTSTPYQWNSFVAKFSAAGRAQWVRAGVSTANYPRLRLLEFDPSGNIVVRVDNGPYFEGETGTWGSYLAKFDPEGSLLRTFPPPGATPSETPAANQAGSTMDSEGNVYEAFFLLSMEYLIINKYAPNGDLLWSRRHPVNSDLVGVDSIAVDPEGNCFIAGHFRQKAILFDDATITTLARSDIFVLKYSPSGEMRWVVQSEGQDPDVSHGPPYRISDTSPALISLDARGGILVSGALTGTVQFGATALDGPTTEFWGVSSIFVAQLIDPDSTRPLLTILKKTSEVRIQWPSVPEGFVLESASSAASPAWITVPTAPVLEGDQNVVTVEIGSSQKFFRLRKP